MYTDRSIGLVPWEQKRNYSEGPEFGVEETLHVPAHDTLHTSQHNKSRPDEGGGQGRPQLEANPQA